MFGRSIFESAFGSCSNRGTFQMLVFDAGDLELLLFTVGSKCLRCHCLNTDLFWTFTGSISMYFMHNMMHSTYFFVVAENQWPPGMIDAFHADRCYFIGRLFCMVCKGYCHSSWQRSRPILNRFHSPHSRVSYNFTVGERLEPTSGRILGPSGGISPSRCAQSRIKRPGGAARACALGFDGTKEIP